MTDPTVAHRFEITVEVPGTPEQVWAAIATANGISSWMLPTELEERAGGRVRFMMGETDSVGEVTGWDPPRRLEYVEPDWAQLAGQPQGTEVTPLTTEFLVEATSGGTCVVRIVSSAFGTGADWEDEFWEGMVHGWSPAFEVLRLYLTHFPGQQVTPMTIDLSIEVPEAEAWAGLEAELGHPAAGDQVTCSGASGVVERCGDGHVLLRVTDPLPGLVAVAVMGGPESTYALVQGHFFSAEAKNYVESAAPGWKAWLEQATTRAAEEVR